MGLTPRLRQKPQAMLGKPSAEETGGDESRPGPQRAGTWPTCLPEPASHTCSGPPHCVVGQGRPGTRVVGATQVSVQT